MTKFKIAVVQFKIKQHDPKTNLKRAESFIKKASGKADIIIFPEDFITEPIRFKQELADYENKYCDYFQKLARKYKINIVPGSWIEKNKKGLFNASYYIDSKGKVKAKYQKINLWLPERSYLNYGNEIAVFNTEFGKVGLIICWDLIFPEIFRKMVKKGVQIVFCPSYWCQGDAGIGMKYDKKAEIKLVNSCCVNRAFENEIILVYCNAAGKLKMNKKKEVLIGQSQITVPFKGVIKRLGNNNEKMFIQEVDTNIIKDAEKAYKIRTDLKKRIIQ